MATKEKSLEKTKGNKNRVLVRNTEHREHYKTLIGKTFQQLTAVEKDSLLLAIVQRLGMLDENGVLK